MKISNAIDPVNTWNTTNPINGTNSNDLTVQFFNSAPSRNHTILKLIILLVLWTLAFYPIFPELIHTWMNHSNNSHGILVPLISFFLIWQKRDELRKVKISISNWGLLIFSMSIIIYLLSFLGGVAVVTRLMIIFSLVGLFWYTLGKQFLKTIYFPLFFLIFMIPVPDSIIGIVAFPLQLLATQISTIVISTFSIPVYKEGNMLYFAQTQLEVAEACSGIRSIVSITMLSVIFIYILRNNWPRKLILLISVIPIALIANIVRVSGTGILAHFYGEKFAHGFLHEFSGIVIFAFGLTLLFIEYLILFRNKPR